MWSTTLRDTQLNSTCLAKVLLFFSPRTVSVCSNAYSFQDDDINELTQLSERLKQQMLEQEEVIARSREDYDTVQEEMTRLQV